MGGFCFCFVGFVGVIVGGGGGGGGGGVFVVVMMEVVWDLVFLGGGGGGGGGGLEFVEVEVLLLGIDFNGGVINCVFRGIKVSEVIKFL